MFWSLCRVWPGNWQGQSDKRLRAPCMSLKGFHWTCEMAAHTLSAGEKVVENLVDLGCTRSDGLLKHPSCKHKSPREGQCPRCLPLGRPPLLRVWAGAAPGFSRRRFPHPLGCIHAGRVADWVQLDHIGSNVSPPVKMENVLKNKQPKKTRWGSTENQSEEKNTWASVKRNKTAPAQIFMKMITE